MAQHSFTVIKPDHDNQEFKTTPIYNEWLNCGFAK